ncbi:hypothetical protein [Paractinoplanes atraurantiacus]|uniref:Uncharacterized protein n=1 Tax=Paractinoplanes atraurantiacus TaxID=1036182 RepID=A0A285HIA2_9ACTN|nr:hypothetical protein [Actinoplanes atraurantiacus]SNY35452.1 hypothetical protein SAMN05421748_104434 [Actinoplanes atraurantiacus]
MGLLRRLARARLAARVMRRLRRAGVTGARYDAHTFQLHWTPPGDDVPTIVELAHFTSRKKKDIDHHLAGLLPAVLPPAWSDVRPLLRPVLRGVTPGDPLRRPVLPFLYEHVVVDHPETMIYVTADQPEKWGVRPDDVFAAARANLSGAVLQGEAAEPVVVHFVDDGDSYWVSHLLLEHWLERLAPQVGGSPVAFAPERGTLLVTADGSRHLPALFTQAEEIYAKSLRPITPMAYVSDAHGCTIPYQAPRDHPLHHTAGRAERILAIQQYALQREQTPDKPLAGIELTGDEHAGWRTKAVWNRDEPTLLPKADDVQVGDRTVAWKDLARHLSKAPGLDPQRWAAEGWPAEA